MNSPNPAHRVIGFSLGSIALRKDEELKTLTSNLFKKVFNDLKNEEVLSGALNCYSSICREDLARDLYHDIKPLFSANSHLIRRKANFVSFKTLLFHPECISELGDLICDSLKDKESSVQIASVTTILEISRINPKIFVYILPQLFEMFESKSNWLIIKILKTVSSQIKS
jgi:hypothetical protein